MIKVPRDLQVWLAARPVDMRKGFDRLAVLVRQRLKDVFWPGVRVPGALLRPVENFAVGRTRVRAHH